MAFLSRLLMENNYAASAINVVLGSLADDARLIMSQK